MQKEIMIRGSAAEAVCFANYLDQSAKNDLKKICDSELMKDRHIRVMPDVHSNGDGTVTGFTMGFKEPVILKLEYGSGCGVACARLDLTAGRASVDMQKLDDLCHEIPASTGDMYLEPAYEYDFTDLKCYADLREFFEWPVCLGVLGGGNHFIELDLDAEDHLYLLVHNGLGQLSGPVVHHYYQKILRTTGKKRKELDMEETCLYGKEREDYLSDMKVMEDVCRVNRRYIINTILQGMGWECDDYLDICHHYSDEEDGIVRHGAISAHKGKKVIIPVSSGSGCILGTGKGNPDWNYSAPHGGGRRCSRTVAKQELSMDDYRRSMQDVYSTTVSEGNLDEAPAAYKPMNEIIETIKDTVDIDRIIRPVYSYKGM